jgi:hypothetical protein
MTGLPGHDIGVKRAVDKDVWAEQQEQDSWGDKAAGMGQLGKDNGDKTAGIEQLGQYSQEKTARAGQPEQESRDRRSGTEKSQKTDQTGSQYRKQRQNSKNMTAKQDGLRQDNQDGTSVAVEEGHLGQGPLRQDRMDR